MYWYVCSRYSKRDIFPEAKGKGSQKMPKAKDKFKSSSRRSNSCLNPFNVSSHSRLRSLTLRRITEAQLIACNLPVNPEMLQHSICTNCRVHLSKLDTSNEIKDCQTQQQAIFSSDEDNLRSTSGEEIAQTSDTSDSSIEKKIPHSEMIMYFNKGLNHIGLSPINIKKIQSKKYTNEKMDSITNGLRKKIFKDDSCNDEQSFYDIYVILRDKFIETEDPKMKIKILTIFYQWSFQKIMEAFPGATTHMIKVAKKIVGNKGILEEPSSKSHPKLPDDVVNKVKSFYLSEEFGRIMPGMKDCVTVKHNGIKERLQKILMLNNLKELHREFKNRNPEVKCSFSKFAALRPKQCILAGSSGTHSVCVCAIHENVKLMIDGANIKNCTAEWPQPITNYHDCFSRMICSPPSESCYMATCDRCPSIDNLLQSLETAFDDNDIDNITYRQWTYVDRTTLQNIVSSTDEYLTLLSEGLKKLLRHSFLVKKQNEFYQSRKNNLERNECIAICDFSENYAFVIQNAIQGVHWNNNQATIHPIAIYYKDEYDELKMINMVAISECLHHDTIAVHLFQSELVKFLKTKLPRINKIIYFSDGASARYKNRKNFINISHHKEDFNIAAEWHFFPTSHGKGPCDGLGGTLKRLAARASLQRINNPIQTPNELFDWATEALPNFNCKFFTNGQYEDEEKKLCTRFQVAKTVKGTLNCHCVIPATKTTLHVKPYSMYGKATIVKIIK